SVSVQAEEGTVATVLNSGAFVALDTELDEDLIAEGYARDIVRAVQDTRKQEDLHVADRIVLALTVPSERVEATEKFLDLIKGETLAVEATVQAGAELAVNVKKVETE
ncbi:DUF5915 domain-containing protein, partial [Actinotignum urinale]